MSTTNTKPSLAFNPHWDTPTDTGGRGRVEAPQGSGNLTWQTRLRPPTSYENDLGDALEHVFEGGATNLEEVVAALNARGVKTPAGLSWSAQNYEAELARLGPAHPHTPAQAEPQPYPTPKP
jgi:hypothetical protein